jgi:hypothetical protein
MSAWISSTALSVWVSFSRTRLALAKVANSVMRSMREQARFGFDSMKRIIIEELGASKTDTSWLTREKALPRLSASF